MPIRDDFSIRLTVRIVVVRQTLVPKAKSSPDANLDGGGVDGDGDAMSRYPRADGESDSSRSLESAEMYS